MKIFSSLRIYIFHVVVLLFLIILTLNLFRLFPLGDAATVVGIIATIIALSINLVKVVKDNSILSQKYKTRETIIKEICDDAFIRELQPILSDTFLKKPNEFEKLKIKIKKDVCHRYIQDFDEESIKKEITKLYVNEFLSKLKRQLKKERYKTEIENFITYLIYTDFNYSDLAKKIYFNYHEQSNLINFFNALYTAYYHEYIQEDFGKLLEKSKEILEKKHTQPSEAEILKEMPDSRKTELESYLVNALKKNLSFATYLENIKKLPSLFQSFLIILGEKGEGQDYKIYDKLKKEGNAITIINSKHEVVCFLRSKKNYEDIYKFLKDEVLNGIPKKHKYVLLATRMIPTEIEFIHKGEVNAHYQKIEGTANRIRFHEETLKAFLTISGKPIVELIEGATIDFFVSGDIELLEDERIELVTNSDRIYEKIRKLIGTQKKGVTMTLESVQENELADVLTNHCFFIEDRANQISRSIKRNIRSWRKIVYKKGD